MLAYLNKPADQLNANAGAIAALLRGFAGQGNLQAGLDLFAAGAVTSPEVIRGRHAIAEVNDDGLRRVQLDLEQLTYSQCSCRADEACRHQTAVLLKLLQDKGLDIKTFASQYKLGKIRNPKAVSDTSSSLFAQDQPYREWQERFERNWPVFRAPFQQQPVTAVRQLTEKLDEYAARWQNETSGLLFRMHALLHAMHIAERTIMFHQLRPVGQALFDLNDDFKTRVFSLVNAWSDLRAKGGEPIDSRSREQWHGVALTLAKYAFHHPHTPIIWMFAYRMFWSRVLTDKAWRAEERLRLERNVERKGRDADLRMIEGVALFHFDIMDGHLHEAAAGIVEQGLRPHYFFDYIRSFAYHEEWERVLEWGRALLPAMRSETAANTAEFLYYWRLAAERTDGIAEWREAAESLLPASLPDLSGYYIETEQYRRWADLYLSLRLDPEKLDRKAFRRMMEQSPDVLLPHYHRAVLTGIQGKSRTSYQEAVKALKVLQALYARLKQDAAWERCIAGIIARTARLRAFQEEMRKGKLLP